MSIVVFTEEALRKAGVGKYIMNAYPEWGPKKLLYQDAGVWNFFTKRRKAYIPTYTDINNTINFEKVNESAQAEVDTYLLNRAASDATVEVDPADVVEDDDPDLFIEASAFEEVKVAAPLEVVEYVFNNIGMKDPDPKDAPSPGAYFYLKHVQQCSDNMTDFYKSIYAKTIPSKSMIEDARKRNDDGRSNSELLARLEAEMGADVADEVSLLCLDLEDEPGDKDP